MYLYKANYNDLISDFNLYLCERYGYRNACSVMWNENGICISIHRGSLDIYIRFWEYSKGVGNYPDWSIIITRCEFAMNCEGPLRTPQRPYKILQRVYAPLRV